MSKILIVDDDKAVVSALKILMKQSGYKAEGVHSPEEALKIIRKLAFDIVLLDMNYSADTTGGEEGLGLIRKFRYFNSHISIIVMTAWSSVDIAVKSLQAGANDFIEKPWDNQRLISILNNQSILSKKNSEQEQLRTENSLLKAELCVHHPTDFVTKSKSMLELMQQVAKVAKSDVSVFISGENGTGKSVLAHYIHHQSNRSSGKFVSINAGAISENLFESEMFGHIKGAFTDAKENRTGRFELANKGTLFIDEIGNFPLNQQAKILRALEEKQFEKVGSCITLHSDVRIISATNADIQALLKQGQFRQDLFYRLNSIELKLPPLRERADDILDLANQFLHTFCQRYRKTGLQLSVSTMEAILNYPWPGNIRELKQVIERSVILCNGNCIEESDLALNTNLNQKGLADNISLNKFDNNATLEEIERQTIEQRIQSHKGNMTEAARSLGLSRSAFYRRLEKLNIK